MQIQQIVLTGKQQVAFQTAQIPPIKPMEVRATVVSSLISTGTEGICFNHLYPEDSHWGNWVQYPFLMGYSFVGDVIEVGNAVTEFAVGDRVATRHGHTTALQFNSSEFISVPKSIDPQLATWFGLAKIAFMGARAAAYHLGDDVLIIGAGPIGQMSTRWAVASGCRRVIVVDPVAARLELAQSGGATHVIDKPVGEVLPVLQQIMGEVRPDIVLDTTGHPAVFDKALALPRDFGKVVLLGDTGDPAQQHLSADLLRRGLHIVGAHDIHRDDRWNDRTVSALYFQLLQEGRFNMDGINTHSFKPQECDKAYRFMTEHRDQTMGILFDWSDWQ